MARLKSSCLIKQTSFEKQVRQIILIIRAALLLVIIRAALLIEGVPEHIGEPVIPAP
jgi:hypothetical protein